MQIRFTRLALAIAIVATHSGLVAAQEASNNGLDSKHSKPSIDSLDNNNNSGSARRIDEEVIVYGEKQRKTLQELATSVAVISDEQLKDFTIMDANDVFSRVANVTSERGGNESLFTIRGVSVQGVSDNANTYTAGVYVDDVALDNLSIRYNVMGIWDVEQIEVYRGPQSTLQGRNALNGAVHIKTQDPSYEWGGKAQAYYGSYNTQRLSVAGGGALIDDMLAIRLSMDDYSSDGYVDNITRDEDDYAGWDRQSIRGKILFEPTDNFSAKLTLASTENDMGDNPSTRLDDPFSFEALSDLDAYHNIKSDQSALNLAWQITDNLTLSSISTLENGEYERQDDFDSTAENSGQILQLGDSKVFAEEIRLNFQYDDFSGVAGIYYGETERKSSWDLQTKYAKSGVEQTAYAGMEALIFPQAVAFAQSQLPPLPVDLTGLSYEEIEQSLTPLIGGSFAQATVAGIRNGVTAQSDMIWSAVPDLIDIDQDYSSDYRAKNMAIFGEATWRASDKLAFTLGARYDYEKQQFSQNTFTAVDTVTSSNEANLLLSQLEATLQEPGQDVDTDYNAILPKAAVQYFWTKKISTAFTAQKGYRAGGSTVNLLDSKAYDYDPEYTWNYELAFRSVLLDGKMMLNSNIFYTDWTDQQVDFSPNGDPLNKYIANAGESNLYGFEIESSGYLTDSLELFGNIGYVKTEYDDFTVIRDGLQSNLKGNEFKGAPNMTATLGLSYRSKLGIFSSIDANYQDQAYIDNDNNDARQSDARTVLNAKIGYEQESWSVSLWATNLTDEEYIVLQYEPQAGIGIQDYATPGAPRMLGASLNVNF